MSRASELRVSLDLLRTRHREKLFLNLCLESGQKFVVDNTNSTRVEHAVYIAAAKTKRFAVIGYHFLTDPGEALIRNAARTGVERVPDVAIRATQAELESPMFGEGFDVLREVTLTAQGSIVREIPKPKADV